MLELMVVGGGAVVLLACAAYLFVSYLGIQRQIRKLEDTHEHTHEQD